MQPTRATWTDERLDDLAGRVDLGFAGLRREMDRGFEQMDRGFERVDGEIRDLRRTINRFGSGIIVGLLVVLAGPHF